MIDSILGLFKKEDWRGQPRKSAPFPVAWLVADHVQKPGQGLEISDRDVVITINERPPGKAFNLLIHLRERYIAVRVEIQQENTVNQGGQVLYWLGCKFLGLKADDWDAIVRYVNDTPELENKARDQIVELQSKADNAFRVVPIAVQNRLVAMLVAANRLEQPLEGQAPALGMNYLGVKKTAEGMQFHHISIRTRMQVNDEWTSFDTQFLVDEAGQIQQLN